MTQLHKAYRGDGMLVGNWKAEAERFCPGLRLIVAHAASTEAAELGSLHPEDVDAADAILS